MTGPKLTPEGAMFLGSPIPVGWRLCDICGHEGLDVTPQLGAYRDPARPGGVSYSTFDRCRKARECQALCAEAGKPWPLV